MGTILYYMLWPLVWFYAPLRVRVRAKIYVGDEVLFVKNWFGPGVWQLPGGGAKLGEPPIQTAVREVREELGFDLTPKQIVSVTKEPVTTKRAGLLLREHIVVFRLQKKPTAVKSRELTAWKWTKP